MKRDESNLTTSDARTFALLTEGSLTSRELAIELHRSDSWAVHSLARLVKHGLATYEKGARIGSGSLPWIWTMVPGATFPGPAPRKNSKYRPPRLKPENEIGPGEIPVQSRRSGQLPDWVAGRVGLAGLVAQVTQ